MYFTQEDYRKIENWLYKRSIKDNDLPIANSIKGNEKIPLLQNEENKISNIEDIAQYVGTTIIPDFYNITENNDDTSFKSLREALSKVPRSHQKLGLVITYRNINDKWCIFQFTSKSLSAWYNAAYWEDILQRGKPNGTASLDETGKIPMSQLPDNIGGGNNLELGETSTTAYPGDKGKKNADAISNLTNSLDSIDSYSKTTRNQLDAFKNTKGQALGIVPLDENGKVASSYLPSYVDDVLEYNTRATFPTTGESGKIYIALDTNKTYRWGGTTYAELTSSITLGETSSTAYAGDKGKKNREDINNLKNGLDSLTNNLDEVNNKATTNTTAIEDLTTEVANTNTEVNTINGKISKLNTTIGDVRSSFNNYASAKTPIIDKVEPHIANKQNPHEVTKAQVGLSNVTNDAQVKRSEMGANNGVATLDTNGKIPESQLPAGVTSSLVLGETTGTAYEGSKGAKHEITLSTLNNMIGLVSGTTGSVTNNNTGYCKDVAWLTRDNNTQKLIVGGNIHNFINIPVVDSTKTSGCGLLLNTDKKKLDGLFSIAGGLQDIDVANPTNNGITLGLDYYTFNNTTGETGTNTRNIYIPVADATKADGSGLILNSDKKKIDRLPDLIGNNFYVNAVTSTEIKFLSYYKDITEGTTTYVTTTLKAATDSNAGLMSSADKVKLDSLSNYTLPIADSSTLGGIKIGSGLNIDSNGTVSVDNKLYILVNSLESVTTPDANKIYLVLNSSSTSETNSFTEYVWITSDTGSKWEKLGEASATVDLADYYTKTEINNKLSPINNSITNLNTNKVDKQDIATTAKNGLLSKEDKTKLDGIATGANKYVLPEAGYNVLGGIKATNYSGALAVGTINNKYINQKEVYGSFSYQSAMEQVFPTYYQVLEATTEKYGLMSPEDKVKLNNINVGTNGEYLQGFIEVLHSGNSFKLECQSVKFSDDDNYQFYDIVIPVATTSACGLLSKEDKVKLDSLSSGGSSNITEYTEAEITTLLNQINF